MQMVLVDLIDAMAAKPLHALGVDEDTLQALLRDAKEELFDDTQHAYINYFFISAQRAP